MGYEKLLMKPNGCCCCFNLRTGTLILLWVGLVSKTLLISFQGLESRTFIFREMFVAKHSYSAQKNFLSQMT